MRPNTSPMLQQNNNNNYLCLTAAGPSRPLTPKCPQATLPFPTRLELGLTDLPLIRGLRAWALCSRNRHKPGGLLGQAPMAPPANSGSRPADVYLSDEWGGYGLPLGLDGRQAGLGALVTVATLKTSEGSGKTQTQCLFLRTEKGSCLYPKPSSAGTAPASRGVVGGWLRGKTRGAQVPPSHTGVHRVRERSGRRWRKSDNNTEGRKKACMSQQWQDEPMMTSTDEERQEEPHRRASGSGQDIPETCKNPRSCQNAPPRICTPHPGQRKDSQGQHGQGESPRRGAPNGPRDELGGVKKQDKHEKKDPGSTSLASTKPDLEFTVTALKGVSTPELETKMIHSDKAYAEKLLEAKDTDTTLTCSKVPDRTNCTESIKAIADEISDQVEADRKRMVLSSLCGPPRTSDCDDSSAPVEDSICKDKSEEAEHGIVDEFFKPQESNSEHEKVIADDEKTCTSPTVICDEKNMIHLLEMEAASTVSCGKSLANQCFSTHANPKQTELSKETDQVKDADNETVKGLATFTVKRESTKRSISDGKSNVENRKYHKDKNNTEVQTNFADPSHTVSPLANPPPPPTPVDSMATGLPTLARTEQEGMPGKHQRSPKVDKRPNRELDDLGQGVQRVPSLDTETGHQLEDEGFGGFMQAEAQSNWSDKFNESHEHTNHKWTYGIPGWTHGSLGKSDDTWAVFPQDWTENREDGAGQWWPHSSVEDRGHTGVASLGLASVFTTAFPSLPASSSCDPCDHTVLTLTQLLRESQGHEGACQDQGLLDRFHDLNKMIGQRYKRASGVSRDLLLKTLHLEPTVPESRPGPSAAHRRLSPGLLSARSECHCKTATVL